MNAPTRTAPVRTPALLSLPLSHLEALLSNRPAPRVRTPASHKPLPRPALSVTHDAAPEYPPPDSRPVKSSRRRSVRTALPDTAQATSGTPSPHCANLPSCSDTPRCPPSHSAPAPREHRSETFASAAPPSRFPPAVRDSGRPSLRTKYIFAALR